MPDELLYYPARVVRAQSAIAGLFPSDGELTARYTERFPESDATPFFLKAEISNNALDHYFTHMETDTLNNFADDSDQGVSLQDSHSNMKLGYGRSLFGRYHSQSGTPPGWDRTPRRGTSGAALAVPVPEIYERTLAAAHVLPGLKMNNVTYASTDDFIRAIKGGSVEEVSVGFGGGRLTCDICGANYWSWDCPHIAGFTYDTEREETGQITLLATVAVRGANLFEFSVVYAGATPNAAVVRKAEQEAEAGRLTPKQAEFIEQRYRVKLPQPAHNWRGVDTNSDERSNKPMPNEKSVEERLAEIEAELTEARAEIERLTPLAQQGEQYRADLVEAALAEGVRANGDKFDRERYQSILERADIAEIQAKRDDWAALAARRFPGGRQTVDGDEGEAAGEREPQQRRQGEYPPEAYAV